MFLLQELEQTTYVIKFFSTAMLILKYISHSMITIERYLLLLEEPK